MEASISFWRAIRFFHQSACSFLAASGHLASSDLAGDFPFLPLLAQCFVQLFAQRLQLLLERVPDDIDLGVVGDGFQGDMGHALIDKTVADAAAGGLAGRSAAGDFGFLELAVAAVGQQVIRIARAHDAGTGQVPEQRGRCRW